MYIPDDDIRQFFMCSTTKVLKGDKLQVKLILKIRERTVKIRHNDSLKPYDVDKT